MWITESPWEVSSEYLFTPGYVICLIKGVIDDVFVTRAGGLGLAGEYVTPYGSLAGIVLYLLYGYHLALSDPAVKRLYGRGDDMRIEILSLSDLDLSGYRALLG